MENIVRECSMEGGSRGRVGVGRTLGWSNIIGAGGPVFPKDLEWRM